MPRARAYRAHPTVMFYLVFLLAGTAMAAPADDRDAAADRRGPEPRGSGFFAGPRNADHERRRAVITLNGLYAGQTIAFNRGGLYE